MEVKEQTEWLAVLRKHAQRYPQMQPQDAVKLAYQNVFGGGHLVTDLDACAAWIEQEKQTAPPVAEAFEAIGRGRVRLQLGHPAVKAVPSDVLARVFAFSSRQPQGDAVEWKEKLALLCDAAEIFSFSVKALQTYLVQYMAAGCPAVHHSGDYRQAYVPAYRVVDARFVAIWPLLAPLAALKEKNGRFTLAIDGMAASGKSTAAQLLQAVFGGSVIHMDDFFLPPLLRTPARFEEPGGNVHYERILTEVLPFLRDKTPFTYRLFDCSCMDYNGVSALIDPAGNVILEGSYALHPAFGALPGEQRKANGYFPVDAAVFLHVDPALQRERILQRNGPEKLAVFQNRWIPLENHYFVANKQRFAPFVLEVG